MGIEDHSVAFQENQGDTIRTQTTSRKRGRHKADERKENTNKREEQQATKQGQQTPTTMPPEPTGNIWSFPHFTHCVIAQSFHLLCEYGFISPHYDKGDGAIRGASVGSLALDTRSQSGQRHRCRQRNGQDVGHSYSDEWSRVPLKPSRVLTQP